MPNKSQHVVPRDGRWAVRKGGSYRITRSFGTQQEAIEAARDIARNQRADLYIHDRNGEVQERDSYKDDPVPPRGRR